MRAQPIIRFLLFSIAPKIVSVFGNSPLNLLSDTPVNEEPQVFKLPVEIGFAAAERIAITADHSRIYYSLVEGYMMPRLDPKS